MELPLSSAVQWWGEWQLQVLTLGSLGLQYALAIFAIFRKPGAPPWVRFFTWLAFLGSDAVAIYALATLFNRQRYNQLPRSVSELDSHGLQVLWAPILLMHLGGQAGITAYNIEDNELWRRYIVTALSQVMVVLWVLYKSWGSPLKTKRFQVVVILLFIGGIIKCFQKPWSLKNASFSSLAKSCDESQRTTSREEDLEKYVLEASVFVLSEEYPPRTYNMSYIYKPVMLFLDLAYPYPDRLTNMKYFFVWGNAKDYIELERILTNIFEVLYIREDMTNYKKYSRGWFCGMFTFVLCFYTLIVGLLLTPISAKNRVDGIVTAVLLFGTTVLEYFAHKIMGWYSKIKWPDTMAQHSLIGYFARSRRHTMLMRFARFFQCKDFLDQNWPMEPSYSSVHITKLVHQHIRDGWKEYIKDAGSYREFNDIRGQWTLVRESCDESLGWSLEKPFDESVLLWHIATDLCFHQMDTSLAHECASRSREISNYMMHLLFLNPEMLMPGSRSNLLKIVCRELKVILKGEATSLKEKRLVQKTIDKLKSNDDAKENFIHDAWLLAQGLMDIGDESKMWKVIQGVWLEMLCFSAGRCRGYLHAKSLGSGLEYLSYVWLLLAHMGMETFSERIQRTMSIQMLKQITEYTANRGSDSNTLSVSRDEGAIPLDEIVVLP